MKAGKGVCAGAEMNKIEKEEMRTHAHTHKGAHTVGGQSVKV